MQNFDFPTASDYIKKALELDDSVWQSHKWYAIVVGSQAKYAGTQQKITVGHEYKVGTMDSYTYDNYKQRNLGRAFRPKVKFCSVLFG